MRIVLGTLLVLLALSFGCDEPTPPPSNSNPFRWNAIGGLSSLDVRYMHSINGILYMAAIDPHVLGTEVIDGKTYYIGERGLIYQTLDGLAWTKIKSFRLDVGPMTSTEDTLFCLVRDSVYQFHPSIGWRGMYGTPERVSEPSADGDMVVIDGDLYVMQSFYVNAVQTFRIHRDGSSAEVFGPSGGSFAGAKFFAGDVGGLTHTYLRPHWWVGGFYEFNGALFSPMIDGLSQGELQSSPTNSMATFHDTLYAGFKSPGAIKISTGGGWVAFADTLPYSRIAYQVLPVLRTEPTAITFAANRLFVATQSVGVLEWKAGQGWKTISAGLIPGHIPNIETDDLYQPVVFLEHVQNRLVVAYGSPGYAPWGGTGVFTYDLAN